MIQATPCELQSSENFKLNGFWEQKAASKDKANTQQEILKIKVSSDDGDKERSGTIVGTTAPVIDYERRGNDASARNTLT